MYLRFLNDLETHYEITSEISQLSSKKVCIYQSNIPENTSGFEIVADDEAVTSYDDYTVVYRKTDDHIVFTSDKKIHYVYYIYNAEGYVSSYILTTRVINKPNTIFVRSGRGSLYENVPSEEYLDENGIYKYKVVDGELIDVSKDEKISLTEEKLQKVRADKIAVLSSICRENIEKGVEYNNERFSYKIEDQSNLKESCNYAMTTGLEAPYHADGCTCKLYPKEDLFAIYQMQTTNLTHNETYFNQLKMYINSLTDVNEIEDIYYGLELTGEYLDNYNMIMKQTESIVEAYTSSLSV